MKETIKSLARVVLTFGAFSLLIAAPAKADTVTLTGVNGSSLGGVYTDPYYATVDGTSNMTVVCDDYFHNDTIGESWNVNVSTIYDPTTARFDQGNPNQVLYYEQAAWLFDQILANVNDPKATENISFALWALFSPGAESQPGWTGGASTNGTAAWWLAQAESQAFTAGEFSNIEILTPTSTGPDSPQELLVQKTPEPSTAGLFVLGLGLLALVMIGKKTGITLTRSPVCLD